MTDTEMTQVPYKGLAPALNDTVAGHVKVMFGDFSTAYPLVKAGKLRALGVSTRQRVAVAPEIAPLNEVGLPGYDVSSWQMVVAPGGTPKEVVAKLNAELRGILSDKDVVADFNRRGIIPLVSGSPEELQAFVKSEIVRWAAVVKKAGAAGVQ
jgi:tripartite-type tricarboxylate transporter receptor subunit TctC